MNTQYDLQKMIFGTKIRKLRISKKLTMKELAEKLNIKSQKINMWENKYAITDCCTLIKISNFFKVSIDYLLGNDEFIFVFWGKYVVGMLSKNKNKYEFMYGFQVKDAVLNGFDLFIPFDNINKIYKNEKMFPIFSTRLPDKKRPELKYILQKYRLKKYNEFKLLKKSGGKLPTDKITFKENII
jgi:HipA-like protein